MNRREQDDPKQLRSQLEQIRAELEVERARWRTLIEDVADEVWLCDAQGKMTLMTLNAVTAVGPGEFQDKPLAEILDEIEILDADGRLRPAEQAPLLRSLRGEIVRGDEIMRHRSTGKIRHRRFSSAPIRDAKGKITGAIAIVQDITDTKSASTEIAQLNNRLVKRAAELKATLAHHAMELGSMARLHEISTRLVREDNLRVIQEQVLDAAIGITGADKGTIQLSQESGRMEIVAHSGFNPDSVEPMNEVQAMLAVSDGPLKKGERLVIDDIARFPLLRGLAADEIVRLTGIHGMQLTPLIGRSGEVIGLLTTHYLGRRRPDDYSLRLLDMLARHATEIMMRRRAEAALRDSEAAMRAFFDHTAVGAVQLDIDGRFTYVNDRYCEITGYSREELLGKMTPIDFTHPEERSRISSILHPYLRGELPEYDIEHRHTRKDGAEIWIHVTAGMIRDSSGRPLRIAAIVQDITTRKRIEEELTSIAQFPNEHPFPVLRITFDGRILYANQSALQWMRELGWDGGEIAPVEIQTLMNADRGANGHNEIEIRYGQGRTMGITCVALAEKGYMNFYGRDTTERWRAEEELRESQRELEAINQTLEERVAQRTAEAEARTTQLRKLASELTRTEQRERRRFAQMLHDHLQQLLVGAKFNAGILERRLSDANMRRYLSYVIDLLDQSIAASRSLTIELSPPILFEGRLVPALQWLARWMQENHGLNVEVTSDDDLYQIDPDMRVLLFQCVRELLFNIVKHARVTDAEVKVFRGEGMLNISVDDRGAGFDPSNLRVGSGGFSGLGLLNIQERLMLHGGQLQIESTPGSGTRMKLSAPLVPARPPESAEAAHDLIPPHSATAARIRVLIADDHAVVRDGLSQVLLSDPSVEVVGAASDGEEAIELTNELHPDVVLMDVSMPRVSGIDATRRLHHSTSIIGLSMHSETDMAARMREAGAVDYLVKTAPPEEVIAAIHHAAHRS